MSSSIETSLPSVLPQESTRVGEQPAREAPWQCVVWDDPVNLMSYVTYVFMTHFQYSRERAHDLMLTVHESGSAIVSTGGRERVEADVQAMRMALGKARCPAHDALDLDLGAQRARKLAPLVLDLSGIAKGYAVDQMMAVLKSFGIADALASIDGELLASGFLPGGKPWTVAVERPDYEIRAPLSILELSDCAVATSGDYRHWVELGPQRLSHTMDPGRGGPLVQSPASVTVLAETCMEADAWATALMVQGCVVGTKTARKLNLNVLFIERDGEELPQTRIGPLF